MLRMEWLGALILKIIPCEQSAGIQTHVALFLVYQIGSFRLQKKDIHESQLLAFLYLARCLPIENRAQIV